MHSLLWYDLTPEYTERRGEFRKEHLRPAWAAANRGELVLGGAVGDPVDTALLAFQGGSPAAAEPYARTDPCVRNGLIARWRVRPWTTVVGTGAATPVRPPDPGPAF